MTNDSGFLTSHQDLSGYIPKSGGAVISGDDLCKTVDTSRLSVRGGTNTNGGATITMYGKDWTDSTYKGAITLGCYDGSNSYAMRLYTNGTLTWGSKNVAMAEDVVPRSGGNVLTGSEFARTVDNDCLILRGSTAADKGASFYLYGKDIGGYNTASSFIKLTDGSQIKEMHFFPNGTWTWNGTAVQLTSDQRLKQQITNIDDKLLDAWQDVAPVQFKYNDAVEEKGDKARLHTGYVVQQINEACQKHNLDISEYGLYCHEEYPERTEEVEVEQEDGTIKKETKVIEEAKEHYSLRYTETLVVECAYLRRENNRLKDRLSKIEKLLNI